MSKKLFCRILLLFISSMLISCADEFENNAVDEAALVEQDTVAPSVPSDFRTSIEPTTSSVNLIWNASIDNIGVSGYHIYRDNSLITTLASNNFTDSTVTGSRTYSYRVTAFDAANNTSNSEILTINTPTEITTDCSGSATQSCTVENGTGYQIRQCVDSSWESYGSCNISCDAGYMLSGDECLADSSSSYTNIYYISASNLANDTNTGTIDAPWASFDYAWTQLQPGDLLIVRDGSYQQAMVPRMSGEQGNPITIRAENKGLAIITPGDSASPSSDACYDGEQDIAIHIFSCQGNNPRIVHDLIIDGFIARGKGENSAISVGSSDRSDQDNEMTYNITIRNTGAFGSITATNNVVFSIGNNLRDSLFEDIFSYGAGRKALQAFGSKRITVRRAVVRYDFWTGDGYKPNDPRVSFSGYNTQDSIFENMIALDSAPSRGETADRAGFVASGNATGVSGITASSNNSYLGVISLNNHGNGFELNGGSSDYPMSGIVIENVISWGNTATGINIQGNAEGTRITDTTMGENGAMGLRLNPYPQQPISDTVITNNYAVNNNTDYRGYSYESRQVSEFANNTAVGNGGGDIEASYAPTLDYLIDPTKVTGFERGATIRYKYKMGTLTNENLWPWPNEDLIRMHMCDATDLASVDRALTNSSTVPGWCSSGKSLSNYIWEYMGNPTPNSVYGN